MKQRSPAQQEGSCKNGALSPGPTSEAGKQTSSQNATKHGFTAASVHFLPGEDSAEFEAYFQSQFERFAPVNDAEAHLVCDFATAAWRLRAINNAAIDLVNAEASHFEGKLPSLQIPYAFQRLSNHNAFTLRYTTSLQRQYNALLKELTEIQKSRTPVETNPGKPLNPLHTNDLPNQPQPEQPDTTVIMYPDPGPTPAEFQPNT